MDTSVYSNPLNTRYASKEMSYLFSEEKRAMLFRKLWLTLAESEKELGLAITDEQIEELRKHQTDIDFNVISEKEREVRHDVMAHIFAYGEKCPKAKSIIHWGATSCFVTDNADLLIYKEALELIRVKCVAVMKKLADFADAYKKLPCLGYTHFQPAQLITVGKRAALWLQDFYFDYKNFDYVIDDLRMRGAKGATGTQATFLDLFNGDTKKVRQLDALIAEKCGMKGVLTVSGQTYTRKIDYQITSALSMLGQSAYKMANDIRLLQSNKELEEPFESKQIGSSAMAYKRNPMRSERICSLSRYLISLPVNTAVTASTQWLERTLDDSANRRIVMGQAFLTTDAILELCLNVTNGLVVYPEIIKKHISEELPFMATEQILMECVKHGGDRQEFHERIRVHSMAAAMQVKKFGKSNDLIERILSDCTFLPVHEMLPDIIKAENFTGRAAEQVDELLHEIKPILKKYKNKLNFSDTITV